jgi:hypothetical protein
MISVRISCAVPRFILIAFTALLSAAATGSANQRAVIDDTGRPIKSIFDGVSPSEQIRNALVLKLAPSPSRTSMDLISADIASTLTRGATGNANACPTNSTCAQPFTTAVPGIFCEDDSGCGVDVHNQGPGTSPNQGTFETYQCSTCCVDWVGCTIPTSPPPSPPEDPCLGVTVPLGLLGADEYDSPDCSPIIVDTEGEGFHLTAVPAGVNFDISGTGHTVKLAWTDPRFHNAFLALPGTDGLVHNGKELFGNFTPQPPSAHPNGFLALAEYDKAVNGGNGDGIIDEHDAVFSKLRLWIDANHDGICQFEELHRLPELGVYSLSLDYFESRRADGYGNQFRYKARVNPGSRRDARDQTPSGEPGRWTYDVFLVTH